MNIDEYAAYDGLGLAKLIKNGDISPGELALTAANAISDTNLKVNAVIETYPDRIENLDVTDFPDGPFKGVPFLIKDVTGHQRGRKIEFGSRLCKGMQCDQNTFYGKLVEQAGFNILGRSNTPEYSLAGTTENALYGNTSTPWMPGYSAGGSTGGGAAAVASGMVPIADGSDIAGSIRIPASYCGIVGLKPSRGRISSGPGRDEGGFGFSVVFGLHKSIRDIAACLDCFSINQPGDPFMIAKPEQSFSSYVGKPVTGLKIGFSTTPLMDSPVDKQVVKAVERIALVLQDMGHHITEESPRFDHTQASLKLMDLWYAGFDKTLEAFANKNKRSIGTDTLEPVTIKIYEYSKSISLENFLTSMDYVNSARRTLAQYFNHYDIWLSPSAAKVAEPHGLYHLGQENMTAQEYILHSDSPVQFAVPYNLMGAPAISLPLGMHSNGLPIGIQLGTRPAQEHILIQLASELEQALPWDRSLPPIHVSRMKRNHLNQASVRRA